MAAKKLPPTVKPTGRPPRVRAVRVIRIPVNDDLSARFERIRSLWEVDNPAIDSNDAVVGRVLLLKGMDVFDREQAARHPPDSTAELKTKTS